MLTEFRKTVLSLPGKLGSCAAGRGLGQLPLLTWIDHFIFRNPKPTGVVRVDAQGSKLYVDTRDVGVAPYLMQWGIYEKYERRCSRNPSGRG